MLTVSINIFDAMIRLILECCRQRKVSSLEEFLFGEEETNKEDDIYSGLLYFRPIEVNKYQKELLLTTANLGIPTKVKIQSSQILIKSLAKCTAINRIYHIQLYIAFQKDIKIFTMKKMSISFIWI